MRDRELVVFALLLKAVIVATPARAAEAQEPGPAEKSLTEKASPSSETGSADDHARRAQSLFKEQRFSDAADELKRAYAQAPNPLFCLTLGRPIAKRCVPLMQKTCTNASSLSHRTVRSCPKQKAKACRRSTF